MSLYDWLLFLHVLSAFALVAALVVFTVVLVAGRAADVPSEVVSLFRLSGVASILVAAGSLGVLIFGIWLAIDVDEYKVWDGWIVAAIVLWAVVAFAGQRTGVIYTAARDRARALASEGDAPSGELNAMLRSQTGLVLHIVTLVGALLLLADMIWKPGA